MLKIPVEFKNPDDIIKFVDIVNKFDCDVDLRCGHYLVDAKSLMSAFTLSSSKNIEMLVHTNECRELMDYVSDYISA